MSGERLHANLTAPLAVSYSHRKWVPDEVSDCEDTTEPCAVLSSIFGGQMVVVEGHPGLLADAAVHQVQSKRVPEPWSRVAKDLFAGDLLAARTGELSLSHEEDEKELLRISESLGLRGPTVDALHSISLADERARVMDGALDDLKEMHLTVVDGVFPQELLARQNLRFSSYRKTPEHRKMVEAGGSDLRQDPLSPADIYLSYPSK